MQNKNIILNAIIFGIGAPILLLMFGLFQILTIEQPKGNVSMINNEKTVYSPKFLNSMKNLLKEEGGYVNNKNDPGGETKYGISKKSYPSYNIKDLTVEDAQFIYYKDFWVPLQAEQMDSEKIACEMLEMAVNMGITPVITFLQASILVLGGKVAVDGIMGSETINALNKLDDEIVLKCLKAQAMTYYLTLSRRNPTLKEFLKGWFNRVLF